MTPFEPVSEEHLLRWGGSKELGLGVFQIWSGLSHTIKPLPNPKIAFNILNIHSSKIDKKQPIINHKRQIAKIIATKHFNSKVATNETQNAANWFV